MRNLEELGIAKTALSRAESESAENYQLAQDHFKSGIEALAKVRALEDKLGGAHGEKDAAVMKLRSSLEKSASGLEEARDEIIRLKKELASSEALLSASEGLLLPTQKQLIEVKALLSESKSSESSMKGELEESTRRTQLLTKKCKFTSPSRM